MENFVRGWADRGAKNHMVVKKNLVLVILSAEKSGSHNIAAVNRPKKITERVRNLCDNGRIIV